MHCPESTNETANTDNSVPGITELRRFKRNRDIISLLSSLLALRERVAFPRLIAVIRAPTPSPPWFVVYLIDRLVMSVAQECLRLSAHKKIPNQGCNYHTVVAVNIPAKSLTCGISFHGSICLESSKSFLNIVLSAF